MPVTSGSRLICQSWACGSPTGRRRRCQDRVPQDRSLYGAGGRTSCTATSTTTTAAAARCCDAVALSRGSQKGIESSTHLGRHRHVIERAWSGSAGSDAWPAATTARLPTTSDSCVWPATAGPSASTCYTRSPDARSAAPYRWLQARQPRAGRPPSSLTWPRRTPISSKPGRRRATDFRRPAGLPHNAPSPRVDTRQNTRLPGACRAIARTSSTESVA